MLGIALGIDALPMAHVWGVEYYNMYLYTWQWFIPTDIYAKLINLRVVRVRAWGKSPYAD